MARQTKVPGDVRLETQSPLTARGMRSPALNFRASALSPMGLKFGPFMAVMAGDTLKAASIMGRIVGKPTTTPQAAVTGSWFEHWLFYVRVGDLPTYAEQMRDAISSAVAWQAPATAPTYTQLEGDIAKLVMESYFLDEDESFATTGATLRWPGQDWLDSYTPHTALPPVDTMNDLWEENWVRYQAMRRAKLTVNTFEEYLAKSGIAVPPQLRNEDDPQFKRCELLQFTREFAYPQPTANPSGTDLAHSVQWFIQDKLARARFFAEPGFIIPCFAVRPKAILVPPGTATDPLHYYGWEQVFMPVEYETDPHMGLCTLPGSLASPTGDTVAGTGTWEGDVRDYLLNGHEQALGTGVGTIRTPSRRPTSAQITALPTYAADFYWRLQIASRVSKDATF